MTNELFIKLATSILSIAVVFITAYVVPFIKAKIGSEGMNKLYWYVDLAVRCADQIYTREQWQEKKEYVFNYILGIVNQKLHIDINEHDIDIIIEGAVNIAHHSNEDYNA